MPKVRPSHKLTLRDRLSRLTFEEASQVLGKQGRKLIWQGAQRDIDPRDDVYFCGDLLRISHRGTANRVEAITTVTLAADAKKRLRWNCNHCRQACEHIGATFSWVLDNKTLLGLAAPPPERSDTTTDDEEALTAQALEERRQRARSERMKIRSTDAKTPWADYVVTSLLSGKTYRVALRGLEPGQSYCSCPDFRTNTLGTCKHVLKVTAWAKRRFTPARMRRRFRLRQIEVYLDYAHEVTLRVGLPDDLPPEVDAIVGRFGGEAVSDVSDLVARLNKLAAMPYGFHVYPDAEEYIQQELHARRVRNLVDEIRRDPAEHGLRNSLLKVPLLAYQFDGVAFAVGTGRAVLADEMGLGKTIQAVGIAELLAREANIRKVLVICPASLKSQWRSEIHRFCNRDVQLVSGPSAERTSQYASECFFTVCNYEQVLRDILSVEQVPWDLIVLDEGQRIKNWESKTSRVIKGLRSRFALVLTGTPLENRLDELYSIVQFVDDRRLGPGFRFFARHRMLDENGKVLGYKSLDDLRARLRPIMLRRTRDSVRLELPERTTELVRIPPTDEQKVLHDGHLQTVAQIVSKKYISEMDLLRLRTALLMCRMSANGTYLVTKEEPNWSSKLDRLAELFDDVAAEEDRKVVLFSEWTTMLNLIEPLLKERGLDFVRLDGSVPQKNRQALVSQFRDDPSCRFFLTTNAGSTGLNLQAANTVINVDLPWNPAVLEQRIGRAHRMGQTRGVQVFVLVTEDTIEEGLLRTLSAKQELANASIDQDSNVDAVELTSNADDLKSRLEVLLGAMPEAPLDKTEETQQAAAARDNEHRQRVAAAGGELLGAVFHFLGELVTDGREQVPTPEPVVRDLRARLDECVEPDEQGRPRLTFTLPDTQSLDNLAHTLARLLASGSGTASN